MEKYIMKTQKKIDINFQPITRENWEEALKIKLTREQLKNNFAPSIAESLAAAYVKPWDEALDYIADKLTKIKINEDCIVGWAEKYYRENPTAKKSDFLDDRNGGEIRKPIKFKDYILPFKEKTNIKFKYLMDKMNDNLIKKELGAFFTPPAYAKKSVELVRGAIKLVPEGNDYIILDRCAGTGSLESELSDEDVERFREQLSNLLENFESLQKVDTTGVQPTAQSISLCNVMKDDVVAPSLPPQDVLANAPKREEDFFKVPPVLE